MIVTDNPLCFRSKPREAEAIHFPSEERTPPEMKMYFVFLAAMIKEHYDVNKREYKRKGDASALLYRVSPKTSLRKITYVE